MEKSYVSRFFWIKWIFAAWLHFRSIFAPFDVWVILVEIFIVRSNTILFDLEKDFACDKGLFCNADRPTGRQSFSELTSMRYMEHFDICKPPHSLQSKSTARGRSDILRKKKEERIANQPIEIYVETPVLRANLTTFLVLILRNSTSCRY